MKKTTIIIPPPSFAIVDAVIIGNGPLVVERFAKKAELMMKMAEKSAKRKPREARNYDLEAKNAKYFDMRKGWEGFNAAAFRTAMISACRLVGFKMTLAKLCIFIVADGYDADGIPLVRIYGEATPFQINTRNATGVIDIRSRPMYKEWAINLKIKYDTDQFSEHDIYNLLMRVGLQVGIGAGRPDSKSSSGCGWGQFEIVAEEERDKIKKMYEIK